MADAAAEEEGEVAVVEEDAEVIVVDLAVAAGEAAEEEDAVTTEAAEVAGHPTVAIRTAAVVDLQSMAHAVVEEVDIAMIRHAAGTQRLIPTPIPTEPRLIAAVRRSDAGI